MPAATCLMALEHGTHVIANVMVRRDPKNKKPTNALVQQDAKSLQLPSQTGHKGSHIACKTVQNFHVCAQNVGCWPQGQHPQVYESNIYTMQKHCVKTTEVSACIPAAGASWQERQELLAESRG